MQHYKLISKDGTEYEFTDQQALIEYIENGQLEDGDLISVEG